MTMVRTTEPPATGALSLPELTIDLETYSDVNLADCGVYKYVESPNFEILLLAYAFGDAPVRVIDLKQGERVPEHVYDAIWSDRVKKHAWNCNFERTCLNKFFDRYCPPEQWEDDMVLAGACGLPLKLADAGAALGLKEEDAKMKEGSALIRYFCIPCKPTKTNGQRTRNLPSDAPDKWATFVEYCGQDVHTERVIHDKLKKWRQPELEHRAWELDQRINDAGIRIDLTLAESASKMGEAYKNRLTERAIELTGMDNPNSVAQIKRWLFEQEGATVTTLNKKAVADIVAGLQTEKAKQFMGIRARISKSSTKKYDAMLRATGGDSHARGLFQFGGASRTMRWSGRLIQLQNLPQNHLPDLAEARALVRSGDMEAVECLYPSVTGTLSELIRTALIPEEGHQFLVADFAAIEARVAAWIAGEAWKLTAFAEGQDIYCATASQMFGVPVVKHGENAELRQKGKIAELACGYGGGTNALLAFGADKMGMSDADMVNTVDRWREANPHIVQLWSTLEKAAVRCVVRKTPTAAGQMVRFDYEDGVLFMTLPSGRRLAYWGARYEESQWRPERKALSYMGTDQKTKKWTRIETFGGRLVENLVQATARDILRDAMLRLTDAGYDIRAHVHDEVVITEPRDGKSLEEACRIMGATPAWAEGLPLRADGYTCDFYMKD